MDSEKKPIATILSIIFASLSLIISLGALWDVLVFGYKWPVWSSRGLFAHPGWLLNLIFIVIAVLSIIVAFHNRKQKKRTLWLVILMLIPGILHTVCYLLLFWSYWSM